MYVHMLMMTFLPAVVEGPPGAMGDKGVIGQIGLRGQEGPQGMTGPPGVQGRKGDMGTEGMCKGIVSLQKVSIMYHLWQSQVENEH